MPYYYGNGYYNPYAQDQLQQLRSQQLMQPTQMPVTSQDDKIFVQGEIAAQAYLVAPGSFVRLWDSTSSTFYEKRADASGRPYMETFEYKRRDGTPVQTPSESKPVDYEEKINALSKDVEKLRGKVEELERKKGADRHDAKSNGTDRTVQ